MANVNKKDLATYVARVHSINKTMAEAIVSDVFDRVRDEIASGNAVVVHGFGKFEQKTRAARVGRNPHTGEALDIAEKKVIAFKPAKQARDEVAA